MKVFSTPALLLSVIVAAAASAQDSATAGSLDALVPLLGRWEGGLVGEDAHALLAISGVHTAVDGVWAETGALTRLNSGDAVPVRIQFTADSESNAVYARVAAKASSGVNFRLEVAPGGTLSWIELTPAETAARRVQFVPQPEECWRAALEVQQADGTWKETRAVTYQPADIRVAVSGLTFLIPRTWERGTPKGDAQKAVLVLPGETLSDIAPSLILYHFGAAGAGTVDANLARWAAQVQQPEDSPPAPAASPLEVGELKVHRIEVSGDYKEQDGVNRPGSTLWGAIIEGTGGPYYFKLVGPKATVARWQESLERLVQSLAPAPPR